MITKYGVDVVVRFSALAIVVLSLTMLFTAPGGLRYTMFTIVGAAVIFILSFFRDPDRTPPAGNNLVLSPADGKVVLIKELFEQEYLKQDAIQISIFMSPLNVHVNRFPISGTVGYFKHFPGEYLVAYEEKSSERNERTHIGVENNGYRILFKQIAGAIARRIVADIEVGQKTIRGERFGMIKFGSRVDVIMPKSSSVKVALQQKVTAGVTVLATCTIPLQSQEYAAHDIGNNVRTKG